MEVRYITIPVKTEADDSLLLEIAYSMVMDMIVQLEGYGFVVEADDGSGDAPEELQTSAGAK